MCRVSIYVTGVSEGQEREKGSIFEENFPELKKDYSPQIPKYQTRVNTKRTHHSGKTKQREDLKLREKNYFQKNGRLTAGFSAAINGK